MGPLALASAAWYGALVYLGAMAGHNWQQIMAMVSRFQGWLVAGVLALRLREWS